MISHFVIVGHVDHGKSTLIGRLLYDTHSIADDKIRELAGGKNAPFDFAYFLDSFKEEREKQMTIDTTQVRLKAHRGILTIIDAPGHKELIRNMITGASYATMGVLVVDAKDGIQEQTRRHAYILALLGIKKLIVAVNKMDALSYSKASYQKVVNGLEVFLKGLDHEVIAYVPLSGLKGENVVKKSKLMAWYKGPSLLLAMEGQRNQGKVAHDEVFFSVQDVYEHEKRPLAVGRVDAGMLKCGQSLHVLPSGKKVRVASIAKFLSRQKSASEGESIGITLDDGSFLTRGDVLSSEKSERCVAHSIRATLLVLSKVIKAASDFTLKCSSQEGRAVLETIEECRDSATLQEKKQPLDELKWLDVAKVALRLESPLAVTPFIVSETLGRFVLLDEDGEISAAGITESIGA